MPRFRLLLGKTFYLQHDIPFQMLTCSLLKSLESPFWPGTNFHANTQARTSSNTDSGTQFPTEPED